MAGISISHKDKARWDAMAEKERGLRQAGFIRIAGADEAGRGPLAGPVVAAAVILCDRPIYGINDSKRMTPARREYLYDVILDRCEVAIAQATPQEIDAINILEATRKAMRQALTRLAPEYALLDALTLTDLACRQESVIRGDTLVNAIAAASIVAKVTRDRLMLLYDRQYPVYGFAAHKGYGTQRHMDAIRRHGPCPIHRRSFITRIPAP